METVLNAGFHPPKIKRPELWKRQGVFSNHAIFHGAR